MTREIKVGLVVSCSFVCLVGVVVSTKLREKNQAAKADATSSLSQMHAPLLSLSISARYFSCSASSSGVGGRTTSSKALAPPFAISKVACGSSSISKSLARRPKVAFRAR